MSASYAVATGLPGMSRTRKNVPLATTQIITRPVSSRAPSLRASLICSPAWWSGPAAAAGGGEAYRCRRRLAACYLECTYPYVIHTPGDRLSCASLPMGQSPNRLLLTNWTLM